jgi:hypothetical protein
MKRVVKVRKARRVLSIPAALAVLPLREMQGLPVLQAWLAW